MSGDRNVTIKVKQGRGNKVHIFLDGEYAATATLHFWSVYGLKNGDEISEDEWESLKDKIAYEKMYGRALDLLAMRDHSERELSDKLLKKCGFDTKAQVEDVCAELKERGYLDDRRFATAYAEELIRKKHPAPSGLRAALFAKGIPRDIVNEVMDSVEIDTRSFINELLDTRYRNVDLTNETLRNRTFSALLRLGYSYSEIKSVFYERTHID